MGKVTPNTEQLPHWVRDLKESLRGDLNGKAQAARKGLLESESRRQRDRYLSREAYERKEEAKDDCKGYYQRDIVARFGTLRLRIARGRGRSFLPPGMRAFERRAAPPEGSWRLRARARRRWAGQRRHRGGWGARRSSRKPA